MLGIEEIQRADMRPAAVDAVRHGVNPRFAVDERRVGAGEHRAGQMGRRGHDVQSDQDALHHRLVQELVVAARPAAASVDGPLGGGEQGPRAASEVRDPQILNRASVRPVDAEPVDRQFREEARGRRQRVERGEELAIRDQGLEHPPRQVVIGRRPELRQLGYRRRDWLHDPPHDLDRHVRHDVPSDPEDRIVIHSENFVPSPQ